MNISLTAAAAKKKKAKKPLGFGLNSRGGNVFGDDKDDESDDNNQVAPEDTRAAVNQALRAEQEALRQRAQKELQAQSTAVYEYDAAYDSFQPSQSADADNKSDKQQPKRSRYIEKLLQTAQERQLDRDIAYERKVAREQQQEEDANVELRGKERFVTAAYKRKLQERKLWQDKRNKQDDDKDTTPRGMSNFYGNLSHNVAMGGGDEANNDEDHDKLATEPIDSQLKGKAAGGNNVVGFMEGFTNGDDDDDEKEGDNAEQEEMESSTAAAKTSQDPEIRRQEQRRQREEKVAQAKIRYMQRHGIEAN